MTKYGIKRACIAIAVLFAVNIAVITLAQRADAASYKRGSTGSVVSEIQQKLKDWGYYSADVDGVYDKDPRLYPDAMKFDWISYEKMRRLIAGGAQVLHDRSVELAQRFGLAIEVLSSFTGQPGTIVCAEESGT